MPMQTEIKPRTTGTEKIGQSERRRLRVLLCYCSQVQITVTEVQSGAPRCDGANKSESSQIGKVPGTELFKHVQQRLQCFAEHCMRRRHELVGLVKELCDLETEILREFGVVLHVMTETLRCVHVGGVCLQIFEHMPRD